MGEDVEKLETCALLVGVQNSAAAMEKSGAAPQKIKNKIPYNLEIPLLGIHAKGLQPGSRRDISTLMFIVALFTITKM